MPTYRLARTAPVPAEPPVLDAAQRAVVDHPGGPLLVLAGPGTGKTTTLVETVAARVRRGVDPERVLLLTFARRAAEELRERLVARLHGGADGAGSGAVPLVTTFHAFCYGLVRLASDDERFADPVTLLSAPEHDARIGELLGGSLSTVADRWPARLRPALRTHGFARELQAFFARVRAHGLDPEHVRALAGREGRADWQVAAAFHEEVLQVLDAQGLIDHAELVHRARLHLLDPLTGPAVAARYDLVVVDEYQDTDPAQVSLLRALAGGGRDLVAVGDPDQSIYAFRGADVGGLWSFPHDFATPAGPAPVRSLGSTRRFGTAIARATRSIVASVGASGPVDADTFWAFRNPTPLADDPGEVVVQTFSSAAAEADHVATLLRRAHLDDGLGWGEMAVLVRSVTATVPRLQRALAAAGVPVDVVGDEVPLHAEPAVGALLLALGVADRLAQGGVPSPAEAHDVLTGPLGRLDATALRRLGRALRRADAETGDGAARPSSVLLAEALADPALLAGARDGGPGPAAVRAGEVADRLRATAALVARRASIEEALWSLWDGSTWSRRLRSQAEAGLDDAESAHRDLDAVCALFAVAERADEHRRHRGVGAFVEEVRAHRIPADVRTRRGASRDAVRVMTAHRAKGLEWPLVVVAGVQDDTWPDLRHRGTLLQPDRIGPAGTVLPTTTRPAVLAEERRLFYVACTRARSRLVVTAVQGAGDDALQPSRFLLDLRPHATVASREPLGRPARPLSLRGVVGELRALAETSSDPAVRDAAAARLAALAASGVGPAASARPERWWGTRRVTASQAPVRDPDQPLRLSGSSLAGLVGCPLAWFLGHEARGDAPSSAAQGFGLAVHALAAELVRADAGAAGSEAALAAHLDGVWDELAFAAPWIGARERDEAARAVRRLLSWHRADRGRTAVAVEHPFEVGLGVLGTTVVLRGSMDRVEVDAGGAVHVVDYKTGRTRPTGAEVTVHPQLGVYQTAVEHGAVDALRGGGAGAARSGGAELVHLRHEAGARLPDHPAVQPQDGPRDDQPLAVVEQLEHAVRTVRDEAFVATPDARTCRTCSFAALCPAKAEGRTVLSLLEEEPA